VANPTDPSVALLTDLYQLTMAQAAWKEGQWDTEGVFHLTFRKAPFKGGYTIAAGLGPVLDLLEAWRFLPDDLAWLASLENPSGKGRLFDAGFLAALGQERLSVDVDAVPEGTVVFPQEPLLRVTGKVALCMLLETPLLNLINFQTLIATKSARICRAARGEPVLEFGLRRAQGPDGALAASRAAYLGGAAATSNVLAGRRYGIPIRGTHAHSWVMLYDDEPAAFAAYARALPGNVTFLVDTYDTLEGVRNAIEAGRVLRESGHDLLGIRLDSGDLAWLSIEARKLLDAAGFADTKILASNDLDEHLIASLKEQGAQISVWGVGTRLVTGDSEPALGGVYKLAAVRKPGGPWEPRIKLSEQAVKVSTPGVLNVRRFSQAGGETAGLFIADAIYDEQGGAPEPGLAEIVDPLDPLRKKRIPHGAAFEDLLVPAVRDGRVVYQRPTLAESRARTLAQLARLDFTHLRLLNPHTYPVGLEAGLFAARAGLIRGHRERAEQGKESVPTAGTPPGGAAPRTTP
jgi:nicotinate phosphoribosyltransferase